MPPIESGMRASIAEFLPRALHRAIGSYVQFMQADHIDASKFKAHHDACKVALAHIKLIIELQHWADLPAPHLQDENHQRVLMELIEQGQRELDG